MKRHIWMLLACLLPLVLLLSFSSNGAGSNALFILLLAGCVAIHLWMMKGLGHRRDRKGDGHD